MTQSPEIFRRIYARHGHRCPMSTLGGRLGLAALALLDVPPGAGLQAVFEHDTCAVDGIIETTGCSPDNATLSIEALGNHALRLRCGDQGVRVKLQPQALEIAGRYRQLDDECERQRRSGVSAEALKPLLLEKERTLQAVLEQLWTLPDDALVEVERIR